MKTLLTISALLLLGDATTVAQDSASSIDGVILGDAAFGAWQKLPGSARLN